MIFSKHIHKKELLQRRCWDTIIINTLTSPHTSNYAKLRLFIYEFVFSIISGPYRLGLFIWLVTRLYLIH